MPMKRKREKLDAESQNFKPDVVGKGTFSSFSQRKHQNAKLQKNSSGLGPMARRKLQLLEVRKSLPIWKHSDEIKEKLRGEKDVMILTGETGSGKSTQVPQFLIDEPWCSGCIAITQPRRVAATSLARRVAEEMGTPLGSSSPASTVGYSVRFDNSTSPNTKIKFLTEGMLLQELLRDPWLNQYSAVVVDEVHERSVNVDIILGFLKKIVTSNKKGRKGKPLKTVIMSATANTDALHEFFTDGFATEGPSEQKLLESNDTILSDKRSDAIRDVSSTVAKLRKSTDVNKLPIDETIQSHSEDSRVSTVYVEGRQYPVETIYLNAPGSDYPEEAVKAIFRIHYKEPLPGDILVFITGQEIIETVKDLVLEHANEMGPKLPKILVRPLYAALSTTAQQEVFFSTPPRTRKIVLATNIAETSVTIPGIRFVIDCGLAKVKEYRTKLGIDSLLTKPISKSAANQRKGRAGREGPGKCYRLYSEESYLRFENANTPEILRCDLAQSILTIKARMVKGRSDIDEKCDSLEKGPKPMNDILEFPFIDRPDRRTMGEACLQLYHLRAINTSGEINDHGRRMAQFPLPPALACVLLAAAEPQMDCVLDMIDIIAALSVENIFLGLSSEDEKEAANDSRSQLQRREGDHMTLLTTVQAYADEQSDRKAWAKRHFVSHRAMRNVMDVRKQLRVLCQQQKLLPSSVDTDTETLSPYSPTKAAGLLKCLLRGFSGKVAHLMPDGSYKIPHTGQVVAIHPSSVLFGRKLPSILYNELIFTTKCYARVVSVIEMSWWSEVVEYTNADLS